MLPPGTRIGTFTITIALCGDYIDEYFCVSVHNILSNTVAQFLIDRIGNNKEIDVLKIYVKVENQIVKPPDAFLSRMIVKPTLMPLSTEELLEAIENNQTTVMFEYAGHTNEKILRHSPAGPLDRFANAMHKYPPIYASDLTTTVDRLANAR
jgi:hypothetical protein